MGIREVNCEWAVRGVRGQGAWRSQVQEVHCQEGWGEGPGVKVGWGMR